jgi:hypothetical protein
MCRVVTCKKCKKPSWAGCGAHVEQVLRNVPKAERCACRETVTPSTGVAGPGIGGAIRRLFGLE